MSTIGSAATPAILMCEGASLQDQRIRELCKEIIASQRREIDQMRALLEE
ncbi:MAG TPA: hypothetical protein VNI78_06160 [Vicinamibacterales bacterium]|nr:hypothetical protein [Vicinamibacterales bacterium]